MTKWIPLEILPYLTKKSVGPGIRELDKNAPEEVKKIYEEWAENQRKYFEENTDLK